MTWGVEDNWFDQVPPPSEGLTHHYCSAWDKNFFCGQTGVCAERENKSFEDFWVLQTRWFGRIGRCIAGWFEGWMAVLRTESKARKSMLRMMMMLMMVMMKKIAGRRAKLKTGKLRGRKSRRLRFAKKEMNSIVTLKNSHLLLLAFLLQTSFIFEPIIIFPDFSFQSELLPVSTHHPYISPWRECWCVSPHITVGCPKLIPLLSSPPPRITSPPLSNLDPF